MTKALKRTTKETRIELGLEPDGGPVEIQTPDPFLTHMVTSLARHARFGLVLRAESRDQDTHHLVEDVALSLGQALGRLIQAQPRARFAHDVIPMDDALVGCYVDAGGRPYYEGRLPNVLYEHFLRSLALEAKINLHVKVMRGRDEHHIVEAAFKGLGRCLRTALRREAERLSTKGEVEFDGG